MKRTVVVTALVPVFLLGGALAEHAAAKTYPTNQCVSKKMKAAGKHCQAVLKAWSKWHANPAADPGGTARDAAIAKSAAKLDKQWTKNEEKAAKKSAECVETTASSAQVAASIEAAINALQTSLGASADKNDEKCRSKALGAAAKLCAGLVSAHSKFIKAPDKDVDRSALGEGQTKATTKFASAYDKADDLCTTSIPPSGDVQTDVEAVRDTIVTDTTTSPNAPTVFTQVLPGDTVIYKGKELKPQCSRQTPYSFFYKRGTVNKLLVYYQGGGACWSRLTCWDVPVYKIDAGAGDNPDLVGTGFADPDNPLNIFKDWHVVFVSYCTGDVHWGENQQFYGPGKTTSHFGRVNAQVAEKFAREHFLDPEFVFVTGSSAGSYGAIMNSAFLMHEVYPQAEFGVLGDAGIGIITQEWLNDNFSVWGVEKNLPDFVPGIEPPVEELSLVEIFEALAKAFPQNRFAAYNSAYDGGNGGQTSFYHVMKNQNDPLVWTRWWEDQCEWTACMRLFTQEIQTRVPNFRSYTGAGSRHTIYGADKLYHDTRGLVPPITFRDWVEAMITDDVGWVNLDCQDGSDCDLVDTCQGGPSAGLPCTADTDCTAGVTCNLGVCAGGGFQDGEACLVDSDCHAGIECEFDPRPDPLEPPYEPGGVVNCAPTTCPCGPTGVNCP